MSGHFERASGETRALITGYRAAARRGGGMSAPPAPPQLSEGRATYLTGSASGDAYADFKSWVYVCVAAIMRRVSAQPLYVGTVAKATAKRAPGRSKLPNYHRTKVPSGQVEIAESHQILDIFAKPNPTQGLCELLSCVVASLELTGVSYLVGGVSKESPTGYEVWAVPSHWIVPNHTNGPFSGYSMRTGYGDMVPLPAGSVCRLHFPDPSNPLGQWSPYRACLQAVTVDRKIQTAQEQAFDMGPYPQVAIRLGTRKGADGVERRPTLTGKQRRALIRAVRTVWNNTAGVGDPAVLDGLIEGVDKLSLLPAEMGFETSGSITKERVFLTFGVNPIVVGQVTQVNKAQAVVAEQSFCSNAVNPLLQAISEALTSWLCPWFADDCVLWLEPAAPADEELKLRAWTTSRTNNDVTSNEWRTEILGLPEREDVAERNDLLKTVGGMTGSVTILTSVGQGLLRPEQGSELLQLFLEIDPATADRIAGVGMEPADDGSDSEDINSEDVNAMDSEDVNMSSEDINSEDTGTAPADAAKAITADRRAMARRAIEAIHVKAVGKHEEGLAASMAGFFQEPT